MTIIEAMTLNANRTICDWCYDSRNDAIRGAPRSMVLLTRLSRVVYRRATDAILGMSLKEYSALSLLREQPNVSQQSFCEAVHLDPNNLRAAAQRTRVGWPARTSARPE